MPRTRSGAAAAELWRWRSAELGGSRAGTASTEGDRRAGGWQGQKQLCPNRGEPGIAEQGHGQGPGMRAAGTAAGWGEQA